MPDKPSRAPAYWLGAVLIVGLIAALASLAIQSEFTQYRERTSTATRNTATLVDQVVQSMFAKIDVSLQTGARYYLDSLRRGDKSGQAIETFLAEQRRLQPEVNSMRIADAQGLVIHGVIPGEPQQVNLSDRPFFTEAKSGGASQLVVAGPVLARIAQKWVLVLARRLEDEQGRFIGCIYANIAVSAFEQTLSKVDLGPHGAVTLRTSDLALVYRVPKPADAIGSTKVSPELAAILQSGRDEGSYTATTALDGIERINAYRKIGPYPLYVIVGAAPQDQRPEVTSRATVLGTLSLAALAAVLGSAYLAWRSTTRLGTELARRQALEASLRKTERALVQAQDISGTGHWVWDVRADRTTWSDKLYAIFSIDPAQGAPSFASQERYFEPESWQHLNRAVQACVAQGTPYDLDCRIVRANGEAAWLNAKGAAQMSDSGEVVELNGTAQDITERKQLALALAQARDELDDLYDHAPCGYFSLDANGRYVRINATMLSWIGYRREEAIGRLSPRDSFSPASQAKFDSGFPVYLKTGRVRELEFELVHRAGQLRTVSVSATTVYDAQGCFKQSRSVMFDVTELRRAQAQVLEAKNAQDAILKNQLVGVVKLRQRRATWLNPALCQIFGYTAQELEGQSARLLYADDASFEAVGHAAYPLLASGDFYRTQLQMRRKDGSPVWIDMQGVQLDTASGESLWMMTDISSIRQQQERLEFHALHDALTGLANRTLLHELAPQALAQAQRQGLRVAICYLDLNRFKAINDHHGHAVGDQMLKAVAERLQACVRAVDVVARVGGDEFVLLLTGLEDADGHRPICERARAAVASPIRAGVLSLSVGVSIGVAVYPDYGRELGELTTVADRRMYEDKHPHPPPQRG